MHQGGESHGFGFGLCIQSRSKAACTSTQSDQSICFLPTETLDPWLPIEFLSKIDQTAQICQLEPFAGSSPNLKALITTAADDKFCNIFPNFRKNKV